jgi:hypothetical protein
MSYDNTNSGFIGKNSRKENDKHPDISGSINIDGKEYWLSGWKNAKGYGLKVKPKEASKGAQAAKKAVDELDDEIPF